MPPPAELQGWLEKWSGIPEQGWKSRASRAQVGVPLVVSRMALPPMAVSLVHLARATETGGWRSETLLAWVLFLVSVRLWVRILIVPLRRLPVEKMAALCFGRELHPQVQLRLVETWQLAELAVEQDTRHAIPAGFVPWYRAEWPQRALLLDWFYDGWNPTKSTLRARFETPE